MKMLIYFHAGTEKMTQGQFVSNGGRVLLVGAKANTLKEALANGLQGT